MQHITRCLRALQIERRRDPSVPKWTMASETSRELAPLVKRADEIQAHHPLMAYYCACPSSRATERLVSRRVNNRTTRAVARRVSSLRLTSEPARATHR